MTPFNQGTHNMVQFCLGRAPVEVSGADLPVPGALHRLPATCGGLIQVNWWTAVTSWSGEP